MTTVLRTKFVNFDEARQAFPVLARLELLGVDGADEMLDCFANSEMPLFDWMISAGDAVADTYGEHLFVALFGHDTVMRTRMQFGIPGHVTVVHEMSDNNYAALGVSFKDSLPVLLHYNDQTYRLPQSEPGVSYKAQLDMAHTLLSNAWAVDDDTNPLVGEALIEGIYPPIVNCRMGFNEEDTPRAYGALLAIRAMVKGHSPHAEDLLFTSESTECNVYHPDMVLRAYDRHSSDYTCTWNFVWRDFAVQWYGRFTRSPSCNRELTETEFEQLLAEAKIILGDHTWPIDPPKPAPLTPQQIQRMSDKLQRNGRSGAFQPMTDEERRMLLVTHTSRYGQMHSSDPIITDAEALQRFRAGKKKDA